MGEHFTFELYPNIMLGKDRHPAITIIITTANACAHAHKLDTFMFKEVYSVLKTNLLASSCWTINPPYLYDL